MRERRTRNEKRTTKVRRIIVTGSTVNPAALAYGVVVGAQGIDQIGVSRREKLMSRITTAFAAFLIPAISFAAELGDYVGYTIAAKKTIVGYVDEDGKQKEQFDGCNYGRKIIFEDQTYLVCNGYGYHYAYRPAAVLLVQGGTWVDGCR